jgi:hypothetical protein
MNTPLVLAPLKVRNLWGGIQHPIILIGPSLFTALQRGALDFLRPPSVLRWTDWIKVATRVPVTHLTLSQLLTFITAFHYSEPRDRIYALLNVASRRSLQVIPAPNYNKPVIEVLTHVARAIIYEEQSLSIICPGFRNTHDQVPFEEPWKESCPPSWVPRFSAPELTHYKAVGKTLVNDDVFHSCRILRLKGYYLDEITSISGMVGKLPEERSLLDWLPNSHASYPTGEHMFDAFWRTLLMDQYNSQTEMAGCKLRSEDRDQISIMLQIAIDGSEGGKVEQSHRFFHGWSMAQFGPPVLGNTFFSTRMVSLRMSCWDVYLGDRIAVVLGAPVPLVLRANGGEYKGTKAPPGCLELYSLVGSAYVHGTMDGEIAEVAETGNIQEEVIWLA